MHGDCPIATRFVVKKPCHWQSNYYLHWPFSGSSLEHVTLQHMRPNRPMPKRNVTTSKTTQIRIGYGEFTYIKIPVWSQM